MHQRVSDRQTQTDRQTDRRTDGQRRTDGRTTYDSNTTLTLRASRGKTCQSASDKKYMVSASKYIKNRLTAAFRLGPL